MTAAGFDSLTLRLLKQALRQLFCKICLPHERGGERDAEEGEESERKCAVLTPPEYTQRLHQFLQIVGQKKKEKRKRKKVDGAEGGRSNYQPVVAERQPATQ